MPDASAGSLAPRKGFGPLPVDQVRFKGFHNAGRSIVVRWHVGGTAVDETAEVVTANEVQFVVRTLEVAPSAKGVTVMLGKSADAARIVTLGASKVDQLDGHAVARIAGASDVTTVRIAYLPAGVPLPTAFDTDVPSKLLKSPKVLWPEVVETTGKLSEKAGEPYVVDDVSLPVTNPWKAPMFTSAFDFLPDGRAVISTFHGDVFVASGIDDKLAKVTWRRFAAGLYHPLGLKVVNGEVHVTCRDGIWKLRDTNGDGEADAYDAFNFDVMVTKNFHEFVFDLQTDAAEQSDLAGKGQDWEGSMKARLEGLVEAAEAGQVGLGLAVGLNPLHGVVEGRDIGQQGEGNHQGHRGERRGGWGFFGRAGILAHH
jgi:hypothetical protein